MLTLLQKGQVKYCYSAKINVNTCKFTFLCNQGACQDFGNSYDVFQDKEGNDFSLSYTADEKGYRPVGEHLPTPPPIPPAIARALRYLATKTTPEPVTESQKS